MLTRRKQLVVLITVVLCSFLLYNWINITRFEHSLLNKKLLITAANKIISVSLDDTKEPEIYFQSDNYSDLAFLENRENDLICAAKNSKEGYFTVLQIRGTDIKELMRYDKPICFPIVLNNEKEILFINRDLRFWQNNSVLFKYNVESDEFTEVHKVNGQVKPIIASNGDIIFSEIKSIVSDIPKSDIKILKPDGSEEILGEGINPFWYETGNSFLYYDLFNQELVMYQLNTGKKDVIMDNVRIGDFPALSTNRKLLAYKEIYFTPAFKKNRIVIVQLEKSLKKTIDKYNDSDNGILAPTISGATWR